MGRRLLAALLSAAVVVAHAVALPDSETLKKIQEREGLIVGLASQSKGLFYKRCGATARACAECTLNVCGANQQLEEEGQCSETYGTPTGCSTPGRKIIDTRSGVHLPPGVTDATSDPYAEDVCYLQPLDDTFTSNLVTVPDVFGQYYGTAHGVHRTFPAKAWTVNGNVCKDYDPRFRPWYVGAASGPKNVVLVIDMSGSMSLENRAELALSAAKSVVETLTQLDFVKIIAFSGSNDNLRMFPTRGFMQATAKNLDKSKPNNPFTFIDGLYPMGGTDFAKAFQGVYDAWDQAKADEQTTPCATTILFLTDGEVSSPSIITNTNNIISTKNPKANGGPGAFIFTYSLGAGADQATMKQIACDNDGVWSHINDNGDLRSKMTEYYQFLASGMNSDAVVWSDVFTDATSGLEVVSAAKAVYDDTKSPPLLLGVGGVELLMSQLVGSGTSADETVRYLRTASGGCPVFNLTGCQMEALRFSGGAQNQKCNNVGSCDVAHAFDQVASCGGRVTGQPLCNADTLDEDTFQELGCCGGDGDGAAGTVVGIIFGLLVFVGCVVLFVKRVCTGGNKSSSGAAPAVGRTAQQHAPAPHIANAAAYQPGRAYGQAPAAQPGAYPPASAPAYPGGGAAPAYPAPGPSAPPPTVVV